MSSLSNATGRRAVTATRSGVLLGLVGVTAFSFSLPATRLAVADLDPWLVAFGRAAIASLLAAGYLALTRAPRPSAAQWRRLAIVAGGVVVGFPLFTSIALQTSGSAHGAVVIALLPAATALAAVARAGERPGPVFWVAALAGLAVVFGFTLAEAGGSVTAADAFLLLATATCAVGYAEGGTLSRDLGGAQTISWALVLSAPVTIPVAAITAATTGLDAGASAYAGFAYVAAISMYLGFFAWYAGLARGGVARIGQVQLLQPLLTLVWAAIVLGEHVGPGTVLAAAGVLVSVVVTQRARVERAPAGRSRGERSRPAQAEA
jgi:drug/metabolite transporter (DMT)-like permease